MSSFDILSSIGPDRERWIEALNSMPAKCQDMHFHPDYMQIYASTYDSKVALILMEDDDALIMQPIIIREIADGRFCDMTSVYGYGGPLASKPPSKKIVNEFHDAITNWAKQSQIVSEYCILHPFLSGLQKKILPENTDVFYRKEIVSGDLTIPLSKIWERIEDRQRKAILSARKNNITIELSDGSQHDYANFHSRYLDTMEKVQATSFWHFPDDYFWNCCAHLGAEKATLLHAKLDGETLASVFHVHQNDTVYYHFSCSNESAQKLNPVPLLLFDSILWAKSEGFSNFHMGGGYTDTADSLFYFKSAFFNNTVSLYAYRRIFDEERYKFLTEEKKRQETAELGAPKETEFFPRYRA